MNMKRFALGITLSLALVASVFFLFLDMTPLAVVKLNKTETITLKQLKSKVGLYEKQYGQAITDVESRKQILDSLIQEKLILQAASKQGVVITDSQIDQYFLSSLSQQFNQQFTTEAQLSNFIKANTGKTLEEYVKLQAGMSLKEYKETIKNQVTLQQYIYVMKQAEIAKIAATDSEIRSFFDMNRSNFVWNDSAKIFIVTVQKGNNASSAQATAKDLHNQYVKDKSKENAIKTSPDNGTKYTAGSMWIAKTSAYAQALGWSSANMDELFGKAVGYVSEVTETQTDYQFYVVQKKESAKMLGISDIVQPESNVTVYEYIKAMLTQQKQLQYFAQAAEDVAKSLDTPANVERKKTGDALNALLKW